LGWVKTFKVEGKNEKNEGRHDIKQNDTCQNDIYQNHIKWNDTHHDVQQIDTC